jgi:hypothetical protein
VDETIAFTTLQQREDGARCQAISLARLRPGGGGAGPCRLLRVAGDRGFNYPGLNASALEHLRTASPANVRRDIPPAARARSACPPIAGFITNPYSTWLTNVRGRKGVSFKSKFLLSKEVRLDPLVSFFANLTQKQRPFQLKPSDHYPPAPCLAHLERWIFFFVIGFFHRYAAVMTGELMRDST